MTNSSDENVSTLKSRKRSNQGTQITMLFRRRGLARSSRSIVILSPRSRHFFFCFCFWYRSNSSLLDRYKHRARSNISGEGRSISEQRNIDISFSQCFLSCRETRAEFQSIMLGLASTSWQLKKFWRKLMAQFSRRVVGDQASQVLESRMGKA